MRTMKWCMPMAFNVESREELRTRLRGPDEVSADEQQLADEAESIDGEPFNTDATLSELKPPEELS